MNDRAKIDRELIIWHISDGRRGHDNQCLGLIQALQRERRCRTYKIQRAPLQDLVLPLLTRRFPAGNGRPDPDLVIGAGHHTHLSMLCAKRARRGRTVVLMRPSLPAAWFDLCLIPGHDRQPSANNVIQTAGALTRITPSDQHDPARGLILIGGPSRHYSWNHEQLMQQINCVAGQAGLRWLVTDSPRTPAATSRSLAGLRSSTTEFVSCRETETSWLPEQLARAGSVWITEDSVSMIYEALTSGAAVGLLQVPRRQDDRITRITRDLVTAGMLTPFQDWNAGRPLSAPPCPLDEAGRCAKLLLDKLAL